MNWKERAIKCLKDSLYPISTELNEIDWKSGLSEKTERLAQHLCAFSNLEGGGFLVFGVNNDATMFSVAKEQADEIIKTLGNIALNNLSQSIQIQHNTTEYNGNALLFIYIPEQTEKPVYLRGKTIYDSYRRSAGQTVKMSPHEVKQMIAESQGLLFHEQIAQTKLTADDVLRLLDYDCYFQLTKRNLPENKTGILDALVDAEFIVKQGDYWNITNLGALLFARDLTKFKGLEYKTLRIILYTGKGRIEAHPELNFKEGYACGFEHFIQFIMERTSVEVIEKVFRETRVSYPERTVRELLANSLIHQDLWQSGTHTMVEIFPDRIEMTNPGTPLVDINRFIDTPPKSRNEKIAIMMHLFDLCELRGSGVDRAIEAVEKAILPAPKFIKGDFYTKVVIYPKKTFAEMTREDRIRACYQHCCLKYMDNEKMTNQSFRVRMGIEEKNYSIVSRIIRETINTGLIKGYAPENIVKKAVSYIPYWG
ncbi:MAG: putative DNA binding domain-containing protein [Dysgonamonadaceae bacterium]|jgi:predicted HTH transcriptional regulator|nr:putative DNA binding domain-containing protein [Dysgonamonadaceae bacterium]